jgi:hypothetical protein
MRNNGIRCNPLYAGNTLPIAIAAMVIFFVFESCVIFKSITTLSIRYWPGEVCNAVMTDMIWCQLFD